MRLAFGHPPDAIGTAFLFLLVFDFAQSAISQNRTLNVVVMLPLPAAR
jgi:hypothetical protein